MERFEDIIGWQHARRLCQEVYSVTKRQEFSKDYALRDQITRAAGSAMHNIAEGFGNQSSAEFARFLGYSIRSCSEVQSQLYIALDQGYISNEDFGKIYKIAEETRKTTRGLKRSLP
mgnify:CR=1 FL=1